MGRTPARRPPDLHLVPDRPVARCAVLRWVTPFDAERWQDGRLGLSPGQRSRSGRMEETGPWRNKFSAGWR